MGRERERVVAVPYCMCRDRYPHRAGLGGGCVLVGSGSHGGHCNSGWCLRCGCYCWPAGAASGYVAPRQPGAWASTTTTIERLTLTSITSSIADTKQNIASHQQRTVHHRSLTKRNILLQTLASRYLDCRRHTTHHHHPAYASSIARPPPSITLQPWLLATRAASKRPRMPSRQILARQSRSTRRLSPRLPPPPQTPPRASTKPL